MSRGPLPNPNRRRRNAPTIPTTDLPARGRPGDAPEPPATVELADSARAWWTWAWSTPQAAGWSAGDLYLIARRASLEDDLATIGAVESVDLLRAMGTELPSQFIDMVGRLAALATGRLPIYREMRELDDRLGLTPKGLAALRWTIVDDEMPGEQVDDSPPLETFTVKELRSMVAERKIKTYGRLKKADLLALLEAPATVTNLDDRRARLTANAP